MTVSDLAISVSGLRKSYGSQLVLDGVDLAAGTGRLLALLGPSGSGKTTTVRILSTLIPADGGQARVLGGGIRADADAVRRRIGVTGQFSALDLLLTGRENLRLMADLWHLGRTGSRRRIDELLELFDLACAADRPASGYSGGMKRRLDLAMTLTGRPELIFLDEPTSGLDPRSRRDLWRLVQELVADGVTVLLTTQYLDEADALAHDVVVLEHGRVVASGTPDELKRRVPGGQVRLRLAYAEDLESVAGRHPGAVVDREACAVTVPTDGSLAELRRLLDDVAGGRSRDRCR